MCFLNVLKSAGTFFTPMYKKLVICLDDTDKSVYTVTVNFLEEEALVLPRFLF